MLPSHMWTKSLIRLILDQDASTFLQVRIALKSSSQILEGLGSTTNMSNVSSKALLVHWLKMLKDHPSINTKLKQIQLMVCIEQWEMVKILIRMHMVRG